MTRHAAEKWAEALPLVLGIRTAYKEDLQSSAAELVYGEPLRFLGEFLIPAALKVEPSIFIMQLRRHMNQLRPPQQHGMHPRPHASTKTCRIPHKSSCGKTP